MIQIQSFFRFEPDWYRIEEARDPVLRYYRLLRSVLKDKPHLRKCLKRCRHCRIYFLTDPRNACRDDIRCPFGCRQAHRKEGEKKRCAEYYRSRAGKIKKKELNARRTQRDTSEKSPKGSKEEPPPMAVEPPLDNQLIIHIQTVTSLIEDCFVPLKDILRMISRILRQPSMYKGEKLPYLGPGQHKNPP